MEVDARDSTPSNLGLDRVPDLPMRSFTLLTLTLLLASCAQTGRHWDAIDEEYAPPREGANRIQGLVGLTELTDIKMRLDPSEGVIESNDDDATFPMLGAQMQFPMSVGRVELGLEWGGSASFEGDREAYVVDTGVVVVRADNELLLFDISFGAYVSKYISKTLRLYAGAGPLFQYVEADFDYDDVPDAPDSFHESGFGLGAYGRVGLEMDISPGTSVGFVLRWIDSTVDLGGRFDDIDLQGYQFAFVMSESF